MNEALSSLTGQPGDLIKSQLSFAQYINATYGWVGNLKFMAPPNGYKIKLTTPGTLVYPPPSTNLTGGGNSNLANLVHEQTSVVEAQKRRDTRASSAQITESSPSAEAGRAGNQQILNFWMVDPTQFEYSMTLVGMLSANGQNATTATMELGAFAPNGDLRGSSEAIYIEPLQAYQFFLTIYANVNGEQVRYKLFDGNTGAVHDLIEQMTFLPDLHQGSVEAPVPFTLMSSSAHELATIQSFDVQPNPFHTETMFRFTLAKSQDVMLTVTAMNGKAVAEVHMAAQAGLNTMIWKGQADNGAAQAAGIYFVRLQTEAGSVVRKVVLE